MGERIVQKRKNKKLPPEELQKLFEQYVSALLPGVKTELPPIEELRHYFQSQGYIVYREGGKFLVALD